MTAATAVTPEEIAELRDRLRVLTDRAEIAELIDRYVTLLDTQDEHGFDEDWTASVFTDDCRLEFPVGNVHGREGLARFHFEKKSRFDRTHHLSANYGITLDGDVALVRAHLLASHIHLGDGPDPGGRFDIGGYSEGEAVRTADGWRLRFWRFNLLWSDGEGPRPGPSPRTLRRSQPLPRPRPQDDPTHPKKG
ncbi:nuclear transport factor 2 family protein [Streptomyces bambusae]|uniref:nuclear transport factor 2 family protein n=1 Tax=Streptomyces bambusae TaxID=1550616 RepID=UPI001CFF9894|nr:nuclear transport factor 2 family protein [Streptomyces bambusae]MCB5170204.1 nuclear transport factor 2 family protein [Streptomyces bambusae]